MLYKKNKGESLDMDLFKNPTAEYRGTPFWSWNCKLTKDLLVRHIDYLKEMGFGGFHMHPRAGLSTEYLGEEFMDLIKACCDKAKKEDMLAWLYDEDRWPSGFAGGLVTKTPRFRKKRLLISENKLDVLPKDEAVEKGLRYLLKVFDVVLDEKGFLKSYKEIDENDEAEGVKKYAYVEATVPTGRFNNQGYVDTLSKEAIQEFIKVTHESYKKKVGDEFGKIIPAIFTDEPQAEKGVPLKFANSHEDVYSAWTTDFNDTFKDTYGYSLEEKIPEIFWDLPDNKPSIARLNYHDHVCERFTQSYTDQLGKWCNENGIALTGHVIAEQTLTSQTTFLGEALRTYRGFTIPGIDILINRDEFTTAKQAQSAVHQYGREGMLSELYGVTNWDFDFRGFKYQGDWQAALGVTVRVPHLCWISMKGSAKRDWPASIYYQSPWYKEYHYVEDHFARLNTVLTRGKPIINVAVIHPIESCWLHWGPSDTSSDIREKMENNFINMNTWLLTNLIDFDYISEGLLPTQDIEISDRFKVGEMAYKTIVVPECETLRETTFEALKKFKQNGGKVLFVGECPKYIDAKENEEIKEFYNSCDKCSFSELSVANALKEEKTAEIVLGNGVTSKNYVHALREDGSVKWLFLAHAKMSETPDFPEPDSLKIILPGIYAPEIYDTINGEILPVEFENRNGKTYIYRDVYPYDSLLIKLNEKEEKNNIIKESYEITETFDFKENVSYSRDEDNVLVLDMAEYKLDSGEFFPKEEMLIIDDKIRKILNFPAADGYDTQPWVIGKEPNSHFVTLRFEFKSEEKLKDTFFATEEAVSLKLNGKNIKLAQCGWYVDECIKKYKLGTIKKGTNIIELVTPIGKSTSLEYCFLLGDFDISLRGCEATLKKAEKKIGFSDIVSQGLPFYGGNITYKTEIELSEDAGLRIITSRYKGACVKIFLDGKDMGHTTYAPYKLDIKDVKKGKHTLEFKLFGYRINSFGILHYCGYKKMYCPPQKWYTYKKPGIRIPTIYDNEDYSPTWSYEYNLNPIGILKSPIIQIIK